MSARDAGWGLLLLCCFTLAAVCVRIAFPRGSGRADAEDTDRAALLVLNAVRRAEEIRADGGRLILKTNGRETVWLAEDGMLRASGEAAVPADAFFASTDGTMLAVTIRKGGASRTLRVSAGEEAGA